MLDFKVNPKLCTKCEECTNDCPTGVIAMKNSLPKVVHGNRCIRCQHCLAICPTGAISIFGKDPSVSTKLAGNLPGPGNVATLIKGRRSVRRFKEKSLSSEKVNTLLHISNHAPTGVNDNSVLFTVVYEKTVMDKLRNLIIEHITTLRETGKLPDDITGNYLNTGVLAWQNKGRDIIFRGAPHLLITSTPNSAPCGEQDAIIALTTFDLAAQAHGVGTVWGGLFMMALSVFPEMLAKLGIPADHNVGYAILFGEPAVKYQRTVQRDPAAVNVISI